MSKSSDRVEKWGELLAELSNTVKEFDRYVQPKNIQCKACKLKQT